MLNLTVEQQDSDFCFKLTLLNMKYKRLLKYTMHNDMYKCWLKLNYEHNLVNT